MRTLRGALAGVLATALALATACAAPESDAEQDLADADGAAEALAGGAGESGSGVRDGDGADGPGAGASGATARDRAAASGTTPDEAAAGTHAAEADRVAAGNDAAEADRAAAGNDAAAADRAAADPSLDTIPGTAWTEADWSIFEGKIRWADAEGLARLSAGQAAARLGETFVGTTYTPGTLEAPGPEHLVINLRELDCVTFVENVLALVRFLRNDGVEALEDPAAARETFEGYLIDLRYRDGVIHGYPSRLHYFSEWLTANEERGFLRLITDELGGVPDEEPIAFMSTHPQAYRQLADPAVLATIRETERRLNEAGPRLYVPEDRIAAVASEIRDGDVIAATSTVAGLDVAHTGFALWVDGALHLLHAPLVGRSVEISELPLPERILGIAGQDGIMVARTNELEF